MLGGSLAFLKHQQYDFQMGVSLNGGFYPHFTHPKMLIFSRENPHGFVGGNPPF